MENQWDVAEKKVLAENTAQAILKHLKRLEEKREVLGGRWIWELLQNARDAATRAGVNVSVHVRPDELVFRHDGRPFKHEELAHLIYHGTTKLDEEDNVGHFGSGFVSTHLLSRRVRVHGAIQDGSRFEFWLDRSSADQHELARAMQRSMEDCKRSCAQSESVGGSADTVFTYPLDEGGRALVGTAIGDVKAWGPMVLALAGEIASISVSTESGSWRLQRGETRTLAQNLELARVDARQGAGEPIPYHIAIARGGESVLAAVPLDEVDGGFGVGLNEHTPRVFVLFPIIGTEKLSLPVVLQSKGFEPVEDRDGIWLNSGSSTAAANRALVEAALPVIKLLIETAAAERWLHTERLLALGVTNCPEWVEESWLQELLTQILENASEAAIVPTVAGSWITVEQAWLPLCDDASHQAELWRLARALSASAEKLPTEQSTIGWSQNLRGWSTLLKRSPYEHPAAFTIGRLARMVSETGSSATLADSLERPEDTLPWLTRLLGLIQAMRQTNLHDDLALLPSQTGKLRKRRDLAVDQGIPVDLKDIGEALGMDIRAGLLDEGVDVPGLHALLTTMDEEKVVDELIGVLKKASQSGRLPAALVPAGVDLFWWLATREQYTAKLDGFPVATSDASEDSCAVVELPRRDQPDGRLLAPVTVWPEEARMFAALFPKRRVLHAAFADGYRQLDWTALSGRGQVHLGPLYTTSLRLEEGLVVEALAEENDHRSEEAVHLTDIACLRDKDTGLIDGARKSRTRAVQLIEFLLGYMLKNDSEAFQHVTVRCECGLEHNLYQAAWLAPLRRRKWVPSEVEGHGAEHASAQSLSALLAARPDLVRRFETEAGRFLLHALGISPADLALRVVAPDEESRVSLIRSVGDLAKATGGVEGVRQLVDDIQEDPDILRAIVDRKENRERVRRNQGIGQLVEQLLREQLEAKKLTVQRTGIGSDFEVECDFIVDGQEVVLKLGAEGRSTLLEVKSARGERVKMTPRQAGQACESAGGFALCVVPVADDTPTADIVRERSRFVFGIGDQLMGAWAAYQDIEAATDAAQLNNGDVELEIIEGQVRFKVGREVWAEGLDFEAAVAEIVRRSADSAVGTGSELAPHVVRSPQP